MNYLDALENTSDQLFEYIRVPPARDVPGLEEDARRGLLSQPRSLPPKYFHMCGFAVAEGFQPTEGNVSLTISSVPSGRGLFSLFQ